MDRYQLGAIRLSRNPTSDDLLLMVAGPTQYKAILSRALPGLYFSRVFPDRFGQYDWGTYIRGADAAQEGTLRELCCLFQQAVFIDDDLDECFALTFHTQMSVAGGYERTAIGQLVREAKPYDRAGSAGSLDKAKDLAALLARFVRQHPTYRRGDLLAAVPASNVNKTFDLPSVLASEMAAGLGLVDATAAIRKARATRPMKDCRTVQEKIDNLKDAFVVDASVFGGKRVILVDDIYETGFSINEVGRAARSAGASLVLGLVATKTARDLPAGPEGTEEADVIPF
jgi:predicted amidophosphoribosyltransferase